MTTEKTPGSTATVEGVTRDDAFVNEVVLRGRMSADPVSRTLPSGDELVTLRLVVPRPSPAVGEARPRSTQDTLDCVAWSGRMRRIVLGWRTGDQVEVQGAIRRRFYRPVPGAGPVSRVEIELTRGRVIRRSDSASAPPVQVSAGTTSPSPVAVVP